VRYGNDDAMERREFLKSMMFDWSEVRLGLSPEGEPLMQYTQMTEEEGTSLRDKLSALEKSADSNVFLKAHRLPDALAPLITDRQISRLDGRVFLTWWKSGEWF
jgi:hypothetical protein